MRKRKYEYDIVTHHHLTQGESDVDLLDLLKAHANTVGQDGWRLVAVLGYPDYKAIFERRVK